MAVLAVLALILVPFSWEPPPFIIDAAVPGESDRPSRQVPDRVLAYHADGDPQDNPASWEEARRGIDPTLPAAPPTAAGETRKTRSGVRYQTLKPGTGEPAKLGQVAHIRYVGKLENGQVFDSNTGNRRPFKFMIGAPTVITGLQEGISGMRVGETRTLTVPPDAAYGASGRQPEIPPHATLIFEVELVDLKGTSGR
jgi:hypothetical protein